MPEVKIRDLVKRFDTDGAPVDVLTGVDLELARGDAMAITGPSGAGKSTLLHLIGGLDQPTSGTIEIQYGSLDQLEDLLRTLLR